jgi:hypothetical protein
VRLASVEQSPDYEPGRKRNGNAHEGLLFNLPFRNAQLVLACRSQILGECRNALAHGVQLGLCPAARAVPKCVNQRTEILP